jgi:hypothetical protein
MEGIRGRRGRHKTMPSIELIVPLGTYFSRGDEKLFFDWLQSIWAVDTVVGRGTDLLITLRKQPGDSDLRELVALFYRYQLDMRALAVLKRDTSSFWHAKVFGNTNRDRQGADKRLADTNLSAP